MYSAKGATKSDKTNSIGLHNESKTKQQEKTTNEHCILEQCKQIIFSIKDCFKFC